MAKPKTLKRHAAEVTGAAPERVMVVHCPDWPVLAAIRLHGMKQGAPVAIIETGRVYSTSASAREEGVQRGLKLREAQARCPELIVQSRRAEEEARSFEPVLVGLEEFVPNIQVLRPGTCAMKVRGPASYYGGEEEAALWLLDRLDELGVSSARIGIADGVFTAEIAARMRRPGRIHLIAQGASAGFLAPLAIEALEDDKLAVLLKRLGIRSLGAFAQMDPDAVRDRLGEDGARLQRLAGGLDSRMIQARTPPTDLARSIEFEPAIDRVDQVAFGVRSLADDFIAGLIAQKLVCTALLVELESDRAEVSSRAWLHPRSFSASDVVDRIRWQLQGSANEPSLNAGVVAVRLDAESVDSIGNHEQGLFGTGPEERVHHSLSRLQGMLGRTAVLTAAIGGGRGPADRCTLVPWGERTLHDREPNQPWPGSLPQPAPATVFNPPRPVNVFSGEGVEIVLDDRGFISDSPAMVSAGGRNIAVSTWAGPWTTEERWWDAKSASRSSRLQIVDTAGTGWLLAIEHGRWWIEARYD